MLGLKQCLTDIANRLNNLPPVGSVLAFADSTDPNTLFKNQTWVRFAKGQTLVGVNESNSNFSTVGKTGGSADAVTVSHTHTASTNSTGSHKHTFKYKSNMGTGSSVGSPHSADFTSGTGDIETNSTGAHSHTVTINSNGVSGTGKNLQPYITVYYWKRTA